MALRILFAFLAPLFLAAAPMWAHGSGFPDEFGRILNIEQLRHETGCTQRDAVAALNQCGDDVEMAKAGLQAVRASGERKRDAARRRTLDPEAAVEFEPVSTNLPLPFCHILCCPLRPHRPRSYPRARLCAAG